MYWLSQNVLHIYIITSVKETYKNLAHPVSASGFIQTVWICVFILELEMPGLYTGMQYRFDRQQAGHQYSSPHFQMLNSQRRIRRGRPGS